MPAISMDIHGLSHHFNDGGSEYREQNPGVGLKYEKLPNKEGYIEFSMAGVYINSYSRESYYIGGGVKKSLFANVEIGAIGIFVSGYRDHPVPMILPQVSVGIGRMKLNMVYVPPVSEETSVITFSLQMPLTD